MKFPFNPRAPAFNAQAIKDTIQRALSAAGLNTTSGPMRDVTETIRRALSPGATPATARAPAAPQAAPAPAPSAHEAPRAPEAPQAPEAPHAPPAAAPAGFTAHSFSNAAGSRAYKLFVPARLETLPPMLVMLHGCTQSADDFAAGTRKNQLAEAQGILVVYPEQAAGANVSKCWNWFQPQDQVRSGAEPGVIAGIVQEVAARHGADPRRIFVVGLSAGAAMAVILGQTHPELFAAVGAHSGLPYGSAHDIPSALAVMKGGRRVTVASPLAQVVPTIVFHGDHDHTVQHRNGSLIVQQAIDAFAAKAAAPLEATTDRGTSPGGRSYSRTVHADAQGQACIESWTVHGAGHAWSGGSASGSYTDGAGPDASAEMLRFFLARPRGGAA